MDEATRLFYKKHKGKLGTTVLEIGSLNVNGGLRDVIPITVGIDMRKGPGVDVVCSVSDLKAHFPDGSFDSCVSAGTLEHVEDWKGFVNNTWDAVKEGGYLVMTVASMNKGRHNYPNDYWRFTVEQLREIYPSAEWIGKVGNVSYGWIVKKSGGRPNIDIVPKDIK